MTRDIRTVVVVGTGPAGRHIAGMAERAGYRTVWKDLSGPQDPEWPLERAASEADLILEAAPDDLETKMEVYTLIDRFAGPHCLFAATSSTSSVTEIASLTYRAPQVLGMVFSPPFLQLICGLETSDETLEAAQRVGIRLGLKIVSVRETYATPKYQAGKAGPDLDPDHRPAGKA